MDRADGDDARFEGSEFAADQALQRDDDLGRHVDRVLAPVGRRAVGADAVDRDVDGVGGGGDLAARDHDLARRFAGRDVEGEGGDRAPRNARRARRRAWPWRRRHVPRRVGR